MENFKNNTKEEIKEALNEALNDKDEETLPGMGVFMNIVWKNSNDTLKEEMLSILEKEFK